MSTAHAKTALLALQFERRFNTRLPLIAANTLRRAAKTLHRWHELECGDSNDYCSWAIERDETTGVPYRMVYPHAADKPRRTRTPDRERGALKRVAAICAEHGLSYYVQSDPRGAPLYIAPATERLTESDYTNGFAISA